MGRPGFKPEYGSPGPWRCVSFLPVISGFPWVTADCHPAPYRLVAARAVPIRVPILRRKKSASSQPGRLSISRGLERLRLCTASPKPLDTG